MQKALSTVLRRKNLAIIRKAGKTEFATAKAGRHSGFSVSVIFHQNRLKETALIGGEFAGVLEGVLRICVETGRKQLGDVLTDPKVRIGRLGRTFSSGLIGFFIVIVIIVFGFSRTILLAEGCYWA